MDIESKHYTVKELAKMWSLGYSTVQRMFQNEPGVFKARASSKPVKPNRRSKTTWRIPREVAERVYRRSVVPGKPE